MRPSAGEGGRVGRQRRRSWRHSGCPRTEYRARADGESLPTKKGASRHLFIDTQHDSVLGWADVQTDYVADFFHKKRIRGIASSSDGGETWTEDARSGSRAWTSIASSANGARLIAGALDEMNVFLRK